MDSISLHGFQITCPADYTSYMALKADLEIMCKECLRIYAENDASTESIKMFIAATRLQYMYSLSVCIKNGKLFLGIYDRKNQAIISVIEHNHPAIKKMHCEKIQVRMKNLLTQRTEPSLYHELPDIWAAKIAEIEKIRQKQEAENGMWHENEPER